MRRNLFFLFLGASVLTTALGRLLLSPRFTTGSIFIIISKFLDFLINPLKFVQYFVGIVLLLLCVLLFFIFWEDISKQLGKVFVFIREVNNTIYHAVSDTPLYYITLFALYLPSFLEILGTTAVFSYLSNLNGSLKEKNVLSIHNMLPTIIIHMFCLLTPSTRAVSSSTLNIFLQSTWIFQSVFIKKTAIYILNAISSLLFTYGTYLIRSTSSFTFVSSLIVGILTGFLILFSNSMISYKNIYVSLEQIPQITREVLEKLSNLDIHVKPTNFSPPLLLSKNINRYR